MAKSLKLRVCHLLAEFLAYALVILRHFHTAGAVTFPCFKSRLDYIYNLGIRIQTYLHINSSVKFYLQNGL